MENPQYCSPQQIVDSERYPFSMGQIRHFLLSGAKGGDIFSFTMAKYDISFPQAIQKLANDWRVL